MRFLFEGLYDHPYLTVAQGAFTLWMLVDAYRRQADTFWFFIIFLVPLIGPWAYFFAVKMKDFQGPNWTWMQRRTSLAELRYRADHIPTLANHLALAERLIEMSDYAGAVPQLELAHRKEPEHGQVQYCLALCHTRQGRPQEALPILEQLVRRDPRWSNYTAWRLLIETHVQAQNRQATLDTCRELVRLSPTLENKCLVAEHFLADGQKDEVQRLLEGALQDHHFAPGPIRRRNRRWASEARRLLKRL